MTINLIGLLNITIDQDEYIINEHIKLVNRDFFEKQNITMPSEVRFYKTFIVSTGKIEEKFQISNIPDKNKDSMPIYFLWAMRLFVTEYEIINSEWFLGESYKELKEIMNISTQKPSNSIHLDEELINSFKIDHIVHQIDEGTLTNITNLYNKILSTYKVQEKSSEDINLHWIYAFNKFQECCRKPDSRYYVVHITAALEFLLVNTPEEANFRAAYYTTLLYADTFEERDFYFNFLKWAFSVRDKITVENSLDLKLYIDKSQLADNIVKLKEILAKVLLKTIDMSSMEIQERINKMILGCPEF